MNEHVETLSSQDHWETEWTRIKLPRSVDLEGREDHRVYHQVFTRCLESLPRPASVLEIGCAASSWLPYFSRQHACRVFGLDYTQEGVDLARENLKLQGQEGRVEWGDLLSDERTFDQEFDLVVSFGVMEHFRPTEAVLRRAAAYLKPGGLLVTQIPNLRGVFGWGLRAFRRGLYDIHVPMSLDELKESHAKAGLQPFEIPGYVGPLRLNMLFSSVVPRRWPRLVRAGIATAGDLGSRAANAALSLPILNRARRWTVPDLVVVYRKPVSANGRSEAV
ncbi:MAG TPA: class I SAM-dependent methyltransferase [Acidobacteriota bacterium]|nr:class I SAM-dependent methyltransferase [Acidobacteriota bacterium]